MLPYFNYKQYKEFYYTHGRTIDQMSTPNSTLNEQQLQSKYKKYKNKLKKQKSRIDRYTEKNINKEIKVDEEWNLIRNQVEKRDKFCQLWYKLKQDEKDKIKNQTGYFLLNKLDLAHVFSRGAYPHLKYDIDNIVLLTRLFHSRLDHFYHPITGKMIDKKEQEQWWIKIIGKKRYQRLKKKAKEQL